MGFLASLLSSSSLKVIALVVVFAGGMIAQGKIDAGKIERQTLQYERAIDAANEITATEQQKVDGQALAASDAQSAALQRQTATLQAELADVHNHVATKRIPCITYGLVRVLDAAVQGRAAGDLALPAGKSDDACAPVTAADLARNISTNYAAAGANAAQLDALNALLRQIQADRVAAGARVGK